jgi:hypothetical protein
LSFRLLRLLTHLVLLHTALILSSRHLFYWLGTNKRRQVNSEIRFSFRQFPHFGPERALTGEVFCKSEFRNAFSRDTLFKVSFLLLISRSQLSVENTSSAEMDLISDR